MAGLESLWNSKVVHVLLRDILVIEAKSSEVLFSLATSKHVQIDVILLVKILFMIMLAKFINLIALIGSHIVNANLRAQNLFRQDFLEHRFLTGVILSHRYFLRAV